MNNTKSPIIKSLRNDIKTAESLREQNTPESQEKVEKFYLNGLPEMELV